MPKVICTRPNASLNINGVNFTPTEDGRGVISEEISDDAAELFLSIEGYELAEQGEQKPAAAAAPNAPATRAQTPTAGPSKAPPSSPTPTRKTNAAAPASCAPSSNAWASSG